MSPMIRLGSFEGVAFDSKRRLGGVVLKRISQKGHGFRKTSAALVLQIPGYPARSLKPRWPVSQPMTHPLQYRDVISHYPSIVPQ